MRTFARSRAAASRTAASLEAAQGDSTRVPVDARGAAATEQRADLPDRARALRHRRRDERHDRRAGRRGRRRSRSERVDTISVVATGYSMERHDGDGRARRLGHGRRRSVGDPARLASDHSRIRQRRRRRYRIGRTRGCRRSLVSDAPTSSRLGPPRRDGHASTKLPVRSASDAGETDE